MNSYSISLCEQTAHLQNIQNKYSKSKSKHKKNNIHIPGPFLWVIFWTRHREWILHDESGMFFRPETKNQGFA